jgi:hypothetical protein
VPLLPDPNALTRVQANPSTAVARYTAGQVGEAEANFGDAVGRSGGHAANMFMLYKDQQDHLAANMAIVKLQQTETNLQIGKDGFHQVRLGAVTEPGFRDVHLGRYDSAVEAGGLNLSPGAKRYYDAAATSRRTGFDVDLTRHQMSETEKNVGEVYKAQQTASLNTAVAMKNDPSGLKVKDELVAMTERADVEMTRQGVTNSAVRDGLKLGMQGAVHSAVISSHIDDGQIGLASNYFQNYKANMTLDQQSTAERQMKPMQVFAAAQGLSSMAVTLREQGKNPVEINQAMLVASKGDPHAFQEGRQLYAQHLSEVGKYYDGFLVKGADAIISGKPIAPILSQLGREKNVDALERSVKLREMEKNHFAAAGRGKDTLQAWSTYQGLIKEGQDGLLTEERVAANFSILGADKANQLMNILRNNELEGTASIDQAIVKANIPESANTKERIQAYQGIVSQGEREYFKINGKKAMSPDDQARILRAADEKYAVIGGGWFGMDTEMPMLRMTPDQAAKSYPTWMASRYPKATPVELLKLNQRLIERKATFRRGDKFTDEQITDHLVESK